MVPYTPTKKSRTKLLDQQERRPRSIAREVNIHPSTVRRNLPLIRKTSNFYLKTPKPGRPKAMTPRDVRIAVREITSGEFPDATALQRGLFPHLNPRTVQRALCKEGYNGRLRRKKPLLT